MAKLLFFFKKNILHRRQLERAEHAPGLFLPDGFGLDPTTLSLSETDVDSQPRRYESKAEQTLEDGWLHASS